MRENGFVDGELIDALAGSGPGPVFGRELEDLNLTLLAWPAGHENKAHVNNEVDVVTVVLSGTGAAVVGGEEHVLFAGAVLIIPKGTERSLRSTSEDFRYLNIHKRRKRLMPTMGPRN
jgi:mannose-6-phosphate isomerase-like protein (cupin superfamily)